MSNENRTIEGTLKVKGDIKDVSDNFRKREFVVTEGREYPQHISMQLTQDKCMLLDEFNVGDEVIVNINLRGREWTSPEGLVKYFNSIEAWKIVKMDPSTQPEPMPTGVAVPDDLPFD